MNFSLIQFPIPDPYPNFEHHQWQSHAKTMFTWPNLDVGGHTFEERNLFSVAYKNIWLDLAVPRGGSSLPLSRRRRLVVMSNTCPPSRNTGPRSRMNSPPYSMIFWICLRESLSLLPPPLNLRSFT
ncbi:hypothetical protein CsatB_002006 [Cannabis sativa]